MIFSNEFEFIIFWHTGKWFQVLLYKTNNLISVICLYTDGYLGFKETSNLVGFLMPKSL